MTDTLQIDHPEESRDEFRNLPEHFKLKIIRSQVDPMFHHPKPKQPVSVVDFKSAVAPNWLNNRLSKQTAPGFTDQKEALTILFFSGKKKSQSNPGLITVINDRPSKPNS